jgi:hypothetical protein
VNFESVRIRQDGQKEDCRLLTEALSQEKPECRIFRRATPAAAARRIGQVHSNLERGRLHLANANSAPGFRRRGAGQRAP